LKVSGNLQCEIINCTHPSHYFSAKNINFKSADDPTDTNEEENDDEPTIEYIGSTLNSENEDDSSSDSSKLQDTLSNEEQQTDEISNDE
jgi:hypothetical protein